MTLLKWVFDFEGEWTAWSKAKEGFQYRIQVCEDGTFDIQKSDHGLVRSVDCFQRLRNAMAFCETEEKVHLERYSDINDEIDNDIEAAT